MNDLDDLKDAMHVTPDFEPKPLDLAGVIAAGGRLRRRRRAAVGATSGLAVLVLLVGGAALTRSGTPESTAQPAAAQPASAAPTESAPPPGEPDPGRIIGEVVDTGTTVDGADRVLWMQRVVDLPGINLGMVAGRRDSTGARTIDIVTNETEGSPLAPGFHGLEMAMVVDDRPVPAFGYYVGPAVKITVRADGRTVRARQATWSENPAVKLFWFDAKAIRTTSKVGQAMAYDDRGRKLPAGNPTFGVG